MNQKKPALPVVLLLVATDLLARSINPEIGKAIPLFERVGMGNFSKTKMMSADLKGRHVIFDFRSKSCASCGPSFSKLNKLHKLCNDKLDLILVGTSKKGIQDMFASVRYKQQLVFPYTFGPTMEMYKAFVPDGAPDPVWIDHKGIGRAISDDTDLNEANIELYLQGKSFKHSDHSHAFLARQETVYDASKQSLRCGADRISICGWQLPDTISLT